MKGEKEPEKRHYLLIGYGYTDYIYAADKYKAAEQAAEIAKRERLREYLLYDCDMSLIVEMKA